MWHPDDVNKVRPASQREKHDSFDDWLGERTCVLEEEILSRSSIDIARTKLSTKQAIKNVYQSNFNSPAHVNDLVEEEADLPG